MVCPIGGIYNPEISVSAEVETQLFDLRKLRVDTLLIPSEQKVAEKLVQAAYLYRVILRCFEINEHIPRDQVRIRAAYKHR